MQHKNQEVIEALLIFMLHYLFLGNYKLKRFDGVYTDRYLKLILKEDKMNSKIIKIILFSFVMMLFALSTIGVLVYIFSSVRPTAEKVTPIFVLFGSTLITITLMFFTENKDIHCNNDSIKKDVDSNNDSIKKDAENAIIDAFKDQPLDYEKFVELNDGRILQIIKDFGFYGRTEVRIKDLIPKDGFYLLMNESTAYKIVDGKIEMEYYIENFKQSDGTILEIGGSRISGIGINCPVWINQIPALDGMYEKGRRKISVKNGIII